MRVAFFQHLLAFSMIVFVALMITPPFGKVETGAAAPPPEGLRTNADYEVGELVKDIFVAGVCDNITNVQAIGHPAGIGYFENGANVIGLDRGIILATGSVYGAEGPNNLTDSSGDFNDSSGDQDLNLMATGQVRDAVGIEFDFVPLDSFVTFRYVFASEEYCEFVGSIYNDVFGFFISGPGIDGDFTNGARNVALIPGTDDFVAINDVNHTSNSQYFVRNELPADAAQCGLDPVNWPAQSLTQYDGFTLQLTASLQLYPCQTYHIRLVVADVGDAFYDSAVFLEAGSFNIGGSVAITAQPETATEGCGDGAFRFSRTSSSTAPFPLTVNYTISGASTATEGEDFEPLPGFITIPEGVMEAILPLNTINDHLPEAPESLTLVLDIPCACYTDSATLVIIDGPPLLVTLPDVVFCGNEAAVLSPLVSGGIPGYSYSWSTGQGSPVLPVNPAALSTYSVTVTDACGNWMADTCQVGLAPPPVAWISGQETICEGDTARLTVAFSGQPPWALQYRVEGVLQPPLTGITDSLFYLPATLEGRYEIESLQDANCRGEGFGEARVDQVHLEITAQVDGAGCWNSADGHISVTVSNGVPPYGYAWEPVTGTGSQLSGLTAGLYHLLVTDDQGCRRALTIEVPAPPPLEAVAFDCSDLTGGTLSLGASGGTPPYRYSVDGLSFSGPALFDDLTPGQAYSLFIQDANGCELSQDFLMPATYEEMVTLPAELDLKLGETMSLVPELFMPQSLLASVRWLPAEDLSCGDCLTPELTAVGEQSYTVRVIDVFGCTGEATVQVRIDHQVDVYIPNAFSPNGDQVNDRLSVFVNDLQVRSVRSFRVYNRWGDEVFAGGPFLPNDEQAGWDGFFLGRPLDTGLYVYFVRLELVDGSETVRKGEVLLMR